MAPRGAEYLEIAHKRAIEKKTHVSFPQLKYPSLRDEGLKDTAQWLEGKALDDGAEGLWRVHDKLYDLTAFVERHPGGAEWLDLTKGTDITEAFETHHFTQHVWKMLDKYYIREAITPRNSPFTFKDDGFYRTLKRAVVDEIKKVPPSVPAMSDRITDGLLATLLISCTMTCYVQNYWLKTFFWVVASAAMSWTTSAAHNYIHRKDNWRMYLFNVLLWSYRDFRVSHALSHHLYANTLMDLEISVFEPLVVWNPRRDKSFMSRIGGITSNLIYPFLTMLSFLKKIYSYVIRQNFFKKHYRWHDLIGFTIPVWMYVTSGCSVYEAVVNWLWIISFGSYIFFFIGLSAAHHHPKIFKDGDQVRDETPDWGLHELEAVMDRRDVNRNVFKVMFFFGHHCLHHLFPTVDHSVLAYLYPVFIEHCKKFKGNYKVSNTLDLMIGQYQQILKSEPNLLEDDADDEK